MMKPTVAYAAGSFLLLTMATLGACASSTRNGGGLTGGGTASSSGGDDGGGSGTSSGFSSSGTSSGGFSSSGVAGSGNCTTLKRGCDSACTDFPTAPIVDSSAPANAASMFSGSGSGSGPCISDPQDGTLIPQNWLRPRFAFTGSAAAYQITLTTTRQANPLVAYTGTNSWTLPKDVWDSLRADSWGDKVSVQICAAGGGCSMSSFTIAPASAGGSMIYWAAVGDMNGDSWLEGFAPGDESVATTLTVPSVQANLFRDQGGNATNGGAAECIGCHSAVPDGASVTFIDFWPWPGSTANVKPVGDAGTTGQVPSWLTPQGGVQLSLPWLGAITFSKMDWMNEKVAVTTYGCPTPTGSTWTMQELPWWTGQTCSTQSPTLMWMQLDAPAAAWDAGNSGAPMVVDQVMGGFGTSWGFIERTGDTNGAEFANWSHDGTKIIYVSTNAGKDGRLASGTADIYSVPFNNKMGGAAAPVSGASDSSAQEYYPSFSEDDKFIAFDRSTQMGSNGMYYNPYGEVYVVPAGGGTATRLNANDPVSCLSSKSPGVYNSWPKWSPDVESCPDGNTYYWIVFSSARLNLPFQVSNFKMGSADGPTSQLYMTAVTVDGNGNVTTYPALYIWNQPTTSLSDSPAPGKPQSNHTPVWETIAIPRHPTPQVN